ncbi:COQ7 [Candida theae]|uniref:5-demethoxyubiquinone hydroxylase, mitochondrial n=1 Tax=Candida theae TaxID=1198502 RepID=A0AAD5FY56_9ASCO|nr:COQ7 [Candida theae]KAI5957771.1 COQ7 [Candida theae]
MLAKRGAQSASIRHLSTTTTLLNQQQQQQQQQQQPTPSPNNKPQKKTYTKNDIKYGPLSPAQQAYLDRVIRVDQAGELGANYIYKGQYLILANKYPHLKPVLQHMWDQEIHHHDTFNKLQSERRVRPSLLTPLWKLGALGIGMGTALISKEAAMACTVAVETVIGGHYNQQLRVLTNQYGVKLQDKETGEVVDKSDVGKVSQVSEELQSLKNQISQFRDDELEHLDTAVEHDAKKAVPYILLTEGIKLICRGAIWTAERV